jgi:hypothetical protein
MILIVYLQTRITFHEGVIEDAPSDRNPSVQLLYLSIGSQSELNKKPYLS